MTQADIATFELDIMRHQLRESTRRSGCLIAEGLTSFSEAQHTIVANYVLPQLYRNPDLDLIEIEREIGDALADAAAAYDLAATNLERATIPTLYRACAPAHSFTALPSYYEPISEPPATALTLQNNSIQRIISESARIADARRELARRRERELLFLADATPAAKAAMTRRLHREVAYDWCFEEGGIPAAPRVLVRGAQGTGKTRQTLKAIASIREQIAVRVAEPTVEKAAEAAAAYVAVADRRSLPHMVVRGRAQQDPGTAPGTAMCPRHTVAEKLAARGLSVRTTMCSTCILAASCGYLAQAGKIAGMDGVGVFFMASQGLFSISPAPTADLLVVDERIDPTEVVRVPLNVLAPGTLPYPGGDNLVKYIAAHSVLEGVRDSLTGPDQLNALRGEGIGTAHLVETIRLLRPIAEPAPLKTGLTDEEIEAELDTMPDRSAATGALVLLRAVLREIDQPRRRLNGITRPDEHGEVAVCRLRPVLEATAAGVLVLDGTGDTVLNRATFGNRLQIVECRIERNAHTTSSIGKHYSCHSLTGLDVDGRVVPNKQANARRLLDEIAIIVVRQPSPCLVVAATAVEKALRDRLLPDTPTTHYGNLRGRNTWQQCPSVVVVGPAPIGADKLEEIARCYMADDPAPFISSLGSIDEDYGFQSRGWPWWATRMRRMRDGSLQPVEVPVHPDPRVQRVFEQLREAELVQGVDRVRAVFNKRTFILLNNLVLDVTYDRCLRHHDLVEGGTRSDRALAANGILPLGARDLHHIHPDLFATETAARRALENTPKTQMGVFFGSRGYLISYRRQGQRGRLSQAWVDPKRHPDLRAALTAALGPLVWFEVLEGAPPDVAEPALASNKLALRSIRPRHDKLDGVDLPKFDIHPPSSPMPFPSTSPQFALRLCRIDQAYQSERRKPRHL